MRFLLFAFTFLFAARAHSQITLSAQGGVNGATAHMVQTYSYGNYKLRAGWQAALNIKYGMAHARWFAYSGLGVGKNTVFNQTSNYKNQYISYKPLFVTLPIGIGYSFTYTNSLSLNFYTGLYGSFGIGGKYMSRQFNWCDLIACPESFNETDRNIHFGNSLLNSSDLVHANWGAQFGVGLSAWKRVELACMYNLGLSNILPSFAQGQKLYLRSLSVDVKMNMKTFKQANKNK